MKVAILNISTQFDMCLSIRKKMDPSPKWQDARHCDRSLHVDFPSLLEIFIKISGEQLVRANSTASLSVEESFLINNFDGLLPAAYETLE